MNFFQLNRLKYPLMAGAMLLGVVACSNYDDEISGLGDRIDEIESSYATISSMESQIAAVKASIPDLTSINSKLTALETKLKDLDLTELNGKVSALESVISNLDSTIKSSVESTVTEDFLTKILDDVYLTEVTLADVKSVITLDYLKELLGDTYVTEIPETTLEEIAALVGDENGGLIADIVDAMAEASEWVGNDELSKYLLIEDYTAYTDDNAKAAAEEYFNTIKAELLSAASGKELSAAIGINAEAIKAMDAALEVLSSRVAELEGRIQSIVFVPNSNDEWAADFAGKDYVTFGDKKVYLDPVSSAKELTFRVSPASWAAKLTTDNVSLYSEKYTRATAPFSIEKIVADTEDEGKFTVSLKYNLDEEATKGYGIALHVTAANENAAGADYTTSYVSVSVAAGQDMVNNIVYGGVYNDTFKVIASSKANAYYELIKKQYDYTETVNFFAGCDWYVQDGKNQVTFDSLYTNEDLFEIVAPKEDAELSNEDNKEAYEITKTSATIINGSTDLIDDWIESGEYTFALVSGKESIDFGTAKSYLNITQLTHTFYTTDWSVNYVYGQDEYTSSNDVDNYVVIDPSKNAMSAKMFNEVRNNGVDKFYIYEKSDKETIVRDFGMSLYFPSTVASSSDVQPIALTLHEVNSDDAGDYVAIITFNNIFGDKVVIEIPFTIVGMPEIAQIPAITKSFDFEGQYNNLLSENIYKELWKVNATSLKGHITEDQFYNLLENSKVTSESSEIKSWLMLSSGELYARYYFYNKEKLVFDKEYTMSVTLSNKIFGDKFATITSKVTLNNKLVGALKPAAAYFDENGNVEIETELTADGFSVVDKDLKSTHTLTGVDSNVDMVYSINEDLEAWAKIKGNENLTAPAVVNDVLVWNDWDSTEIAMKVEAKFEGVNVAVDSNEFTAYIVNPLADAITTTELNLYIDDLNGSVDLNKAISLMVEKDDIKANIFATYQLAFGSKPTFKYAGTNDASTTKLVKENGDVVSFSDDAVSSAVMKNPVTYTYNVSYKTNYFGEYKAVVTVKVNEAGKSAPVKK